MNNAYPLLAEESTKSYPVDIRALIGGLGRRWRLIVGVSLFCLLATFAGLKLIPPEYQATVQVLIFDPRLQSEAPIAGQRVSGVDFDTVAINTEIEVIKSAALSLRVVRELKLYEDAEFQQRSRVAALLDHLGLSGAAANLRKVLGFGAADNLKSDPERASDQATTAEKRIEIAATILRERLRVERAPFSYVLVISVNSGSPGLAQRVVAKLVDDYLADQRETRRKVLEQSALWLKARLSELKSQVVETETTIEKLKAQSGLSDTGTGSVNEQQIADLNAQLMLARAEVTEKRARLQQDRQISQGNVGGQNLSTTLSSPLMAQLQIQRSDLIRRDAELRAKLGNRHAEVLALDAQLAGINKAINNVAEEGVADLQNALDTAVRREQSLETSLRQLTTTVSNSGDYAKLQQLRRVADADSKLYETYLSQYNEIGSRGSLEVVGARIISPAELPIAPSFPRHKLLLVIAAGGFGFAIGVLLALLAEYFWRSVRTGAQAEQMFGSTVLGGLPLMSPGKSGSAGVGNQLLQTIVDAPLSTFSEAIRAIRISLRLSEPHHAPTVILVTSCLSGEGKSTVATLLAASSAAAHQKTVLVDCDLRGRTISQRMRKQTPGLAELLSGNTDIATATVHDVASGCFVIPAGATSNSPADLLSSRRMGEIIRQLRAKFDYIVLDTPPLLPVVDTLTLLPMADKILLIIDSTQLRHDTILEAFRLLRPEAGRVAGMVFNKLPHRQLPHYRYGAYYTSGTFVEVSDR